MKRRWDFQPLGPAAWQGAPAVLRITRNKVDAPSAAFRRAALTQRARLYLLALAVGAGRAASHEVQCEASASSPPTTHRHYDRQPPSPPPPPPLLLFLPIRLLHVAAMAEAAPQATPAMPVNRPQSPSTASLSDRAHVSPRQHGKSSLDLGPAPTLSQSAETDHPRRVSFPDEAISANTTAEEALAGPIDPLSQVGVPAVPVHRGPLGRPIWRVANVVHGPANPAAHNRPVPPGTTILLGSIHHLSSGSLPPPRRYGAASFRAGRHNTGQADQGQEVSHFPPLT